MILKTPHGQHTVNPQQDEILLDGRKDLPSVKYMIHEQRGRRIFYAYRQRQIAYGERLGEFCELVSHEELQREINQRAEQHNLMEYADLERLVGLGFTLPG